MWLQAHFRTQKNFGSKDRRFYRDACFAYWRCGPKPANVSIGSQICYGLINQKLHENECTEYLTANNQTYAAIAAENSNIYDKFKEEIDSPINIEELNTWFSSPPPIYIVANPGRNTHLKSELNKLDIKIIAAGLGYVVPAGTDIQNCIDQGFGRIMDIGSQQSMENLPIEDDFAVWDCCCGAGGKSLLLRQLHPELALYSSDVRENIIPNLNRRFQLAGMKYPFTGVNNIANPTGELSFENKIRYSKPVFDAIVADVPCSGSGTWRRSPESIHFLSSEKIAAFSEVQFSIVKNAISFLKRDGLFVYVTCSLFKKENTENVKRFIETLELELIENKYLGGPENNGDYLYRAVFRKTK